MMKIYVVELDVLEDLDRVVGDPAYCGLTFKLSKNSRVIYDFGEVLERWELANLHGRAR